MLSTTDSLTVLQGVLQSNMDQRCTTRQHRQHCHRIQQSHIPEKNRAQKHWGMVCMASMQRLLILILSQHLVSVVSRLEGASHWNIDVLGLLWCQLGQLGSQLGQVKSCNLLIQVLGQHIHLVLVPARLALVPQLQLGNHLYNKCSHCAQFSSRNVATGACTLSLVHTAN